jgi:hypothetical protein
VKNGFVFAALIFARQLADPGHVLTVAMAVYYSVHRFFS